LYLGLSMVGVAVATHLNGGARNAAAAYPTKFRLGSELYCAVACRAWVGSREAARLAP